MKKILPILKSFFVGLLLVSATNALAAEKPATAKVQKVKGLVRYQEGQGEWKDLKAGQALSVNSTVKTGLDSEAILLLTLPYAGADKSVATSVVRVIANSIVS